MSDTPNHHDFTFAAVDELRIPPEMRGAANDFRCQKCGVAGCDGIECVDFIVGNYFEDEP